MITPLFNIVTRVSRIGTFDKCYNSVHGQTYKNINHICTYQNDEVFDYLSKFKNLNLVRVPNFKKIDDLYYTYNSHTLTDKFIKPDWSFFDRKVQLNNIIEKSSISVNQKKYEKKIGQWDHWCTTSENSNRVLIRHFPYNQYLKIAEKMFQDGWVIYLDDDDFFCNENVLQNLINEIEKNNSPDIIHIFRVLDITCKRLRPNNESFYKMSIGHPFILGEVGGSTFTYNTKWSDWTVWDEWSAADYRTLKSLEEIIPYKNFIDDVFIHISPHH